MRKRWTTILALAAVLAVAGAGIAAAYKPTIVKEGNPLFFNGGFKPTKLPKDKLVPAHFALEGSELLTGPAALKEAIFEIDRNVALDAKGLAVCRIRLVDLLAAPNLCKGARVGKGQMEFEVAFSETPPFAAKSHAVAYNGGKHDGVTTILVQGYLPSPVSASVLISVEITKTDNGRYGTKLVATIPSVAGGSASMKKFQLEFFRRFAYKHKRRSFVKARCRDGKLQAGWKAALADGTVSDGSFKRPCTPQS